jgi:hypothetical protein
MFSRISTTQQATNTLSTKPEQIPNGAVLVFTYVQGGNGIAIPNPYDLYDPFPGRAS